MTDLSLDGNARWAFLSESPRVAVLAVPAAGGRPPLATPVWVLPDSRRNRLTVTTDRHARKLALMTASRHVSLCVHDDTPPYRYVTVEADVDAVEAATEQTRQAIAARYLGADNAAAYLNAIRGASESLMAVHLTPRRWHSVDYGRAYTFELV